MDPETFVLPNIAFEREQKRKKMIVIGAVALLLTVLVVGGYFAFKYFNRVIINPPLVDIDQKVLLVSVAPPFSPVVLVNTSKKTIEPFSAVGQGTAMMMDAATNGTTTAVYLLSDPYFKISNLYKEDRAQSSIGLSQLTSSQNLKYDLSYDFLSGTATYLIKKDSTESHVVVFSPNTQKETDLGVGNHPTILPGGFFVFYQKGSALTVMELATKKSHTLLTIATSTPFAVDGENKIIAVYDSVSKQINLFSFASTVTASYLSSEKTDHSIKALTFSKGKLVTTWIANEGALTMAVEGQERQADIPFAKAGVEYKVSVQHE